MTISCVAHIINCLQKPSLIRLCQERFLNSSGNKPKLRGRLKLSFVKKPIEVLSLLSIEELKLICSKSELSINGTINQLIDHIMDIELCKHNKTVDENESSEDDDDDEDDEEDEEDDDDDDDDEGEGYSIDLSNEEVMQLTVKEILNGEEGSYTKKCVYLFSDEKDILYIGKSQSKTVRERLLEHLGMGFIPAETVFDKALQQAGKSAMDWTVQILTLDECNKIFKKIDCPLRRKLKKAENALIRLIEPKYNIQGNPNYKKPSP